MDGHDTPAMAIESSPTRLNVAYPTMTNNKENGLTYNHYNNREIKFLNTSKSLKSLYLNKQQIGIKNE